MTAEPPPVSAPIHRPNPGNFTTETATKAVQLAIAARRAKAERLRNQPPSPPEPIQSPPVQDFAGKRLMRVREQLDRIDALAAREDDPKRLKELADATTRLSEQERVLAGRPLPGSRRPAQERASKGRDAGAWLAEPMPAAPVAAPEVAQVQPAAPEPDPIRPPGPPDKAEYL